jgi:hypothetical protein
VTCRLSQAFLDRIIEIELAGHQQRLCLDVNLELLQMSNWRHGDSPARRQEPVTFDDTQTTTAALTRATSDHGYPAEVTKPATKS